MLIYSEILIYFITDIVVQVIAKYNNIKESLLCTLSKNEKIWQIPLDLIFEKGITVTFWATGGIFGLSGNYLRRRRRCCGVDGRKF